MRKLLIWLPWILLIIVISCFFIWQKEHKPTEVMSADGIALQNEKSDPLIEQTRQGGISSYHEAVKFASPAVVNIFATSKVDNAQNLLLSDPVLRELFGENNPYNQQNQNNSLGSGVIVREDGYILTNNHVIAGADEIVVALQDGRQAKATIVGTDVDTDLAVIKVDLKDLPVLPFKLSGNQVGDVVLAIGNPFGVGQTVTQGIISATERQDLGINTYENFVQTDAAINPGNSGGALIDVAGNLVGVNTAIFSRSGGSMGIGFAIPASISKQVLDSILQHGRVVRGWLGVSLVRHQNNENNPLKPNPAIIADVMPEGPSAQSGLQAGDEIIQINEEKIKSATHLVNYIALQAPGSMVKILVNRGGQEFIAEVKVGERQSPNQRKANAEYLQLPNER